MTLSEHNKAEKIKIKYIQHGCPPHPQIPYTRFWKQYVKSIEILKAYLEWCWSPLWSNFCDPLSWIVLLTQILHLIYTPKIRAFKVNVRRELIGEKLGQCVCMTYSLGLIDPTLKIWICNVTYGLKSKMADWVNAPQWLAVVEPGFDSYSDR